MTAGTVALARMEAEPDRHVTYRSWWRTALLTHQVVDGLRLACAVRGVRIEVTSTKGLLARTHIVTMTGRAGDVAAAVSEVSRRYGGNPQ